MNLKTISYVSAWLQIIICHIIVIYFGIQLATHDLEADEDGLDPLLLIFLIIVVVSIPFLIALLVGIKQNRMILVGVFLYATHTLLVVGVIYMIYEFIMGFAHRMDVGEIFVHLIIEAAIIGLEFILTTPIHIWYKRRNITSSSNQETLAKEQTSSTTSKSLRSKSPSKSLRKVSYAP